MSNKCRNLAILLGAVVAMAPLFAFAATDITCPAESIGVLQPSSSTSNTIALENSLKQDNAQVVALQNMYQSQKSSFVKSLLQQYLIRRKTHFLDLLRRSPDRALPYVLDEKTRSALGTYSTGCVETKVSTNGSLQIAVADDFKNLTSVTSYYLATTQGEQILLHQLSSVGQMQENGALIKVSGFRLDSDMLVSALTSISQTSGTSRFSPLSISPTGPILPAPIGDQKVLVILANFKGTSAPALTKDTVQRTMDRVNDYYNENSYYDAAQGKGIRLVGVLDPTKSADVVGWKTLPITQTCDWMKVVQSAIDVTDDTIDFRNYSRLVVIAPFDSCGWSGIANQLKVPLLTNRGTVELSNAAITISALMNGVGDSHMTIAHEMGHGLGSFHADLLDCGTVSLKASSNADCTVRAYQDVYDVMGFDARGHFSAPRKQYMGWLGNSQIQTVIESGRYRIEPIETATNGIKALKIEGAGVGKYFYVEYRQPIGFDANLDSNAYSGALIHISSDTYGGRYNSPGGPFGTVTLIVVADPSLSDSLWQGAALKPGETLVSPNYSITIHVVSADASGITIDVTNAGAWSSGPSLPTITLEQPLSDSTVSNNVMVTTNASAGSGVKKVEFYWESLGTQTLFATMTVAPYSATLDTTKLPNGPITIAAKVYDNNDQVATASRIAWAYSKITVANDSAILSPTTLSGTVTNAGKLGGPAAGVTVSLLNADDSTVFTSVITDADGKYTIPNVPSGAWTLSPSRIGGIVGVSLVDIVQILESTVHNRTFNEEQRLAADASGDGEVTILDANQLLEYTVKKRTRFAAAEACGSDWLFIPATTTTGLRQKPLPAAAGGCRMGTITFTNPSGAITNQDFSAVLIGNPSGS